MTTIQTQKLSPNGNWRLISYDMDRGADMARYIARERYAWPGGYELFAITDDCGLLCNDCCRTEYYQIRTAYPGDGWNVEAIGTLADTDSRVDCDHCGRMLQDDWDAS